MASFSVYNDDTYDNMYVNVINTHSINGTGVNLIGDINVGGDLTSNIVNGTTTLTNMTSFGNFSARSGVPAPTGTVGLTVAGNSTFLTSGGGSLGFFGAGPFGRQALPAIANLGDLNLSGNLAPLINELNQAFKNYGLLS